MTRIVSSRSGDVRHQRHRAIDQLFDAAHIFDRRRRQLRPRPRALCAFGPAFNFLIDRCAARLRISRRWQIIQDLHRPDRSPRRFSGLKPVQNIELCQTDTRHTDVAQVWRSKAASNQPQRRLRPVVVPNSWPRSPRRWPSASSSSVGKRAFAARVCVGFHNSKHIINRPLAQCPRPSPLGPRSHWRRSQTDMCQSRYPEARPAHPQTKSACPLCASR